MPLQRKAKYTLLWTGSLLALVSLVLAGCGPNLISRVLADEPTQPPENAYEYAAIAPDRMELVRQWSRFGLSGTPAALNFDREVALFVGFGESGSCPLVYEGVNLDAASRVVSVLFESESGACTGDYNARTIVLAIDRDRLPDGVFQVEAAGDPVSVAAERIDTPPQEGPIGVSAAVSAVSLELDPEEVPADGRLRVAIRNDTYERLNPLPEFHIDRWTGFGFELARPVTLPMDFGVVVESGVEELFLTLDLREYELSPGWYRITVPIAITSGQFGGLDIRRSFEVVERSDVAS
jgi:hypothetical protein